MKLITILGIVAVAAVVVQARSHYRPHDREKGPHEEKHQPHAEPPKLEQKKTVVTSDAGKRSPKQLHTGPRKSKVAGDKDNYHPYIERNPEHRRPTGVDWHQTGQDALNEALVNTRPKWKPARNVIYFIGDGMGVSTLTAGRIFKAQRDGQSVTDAKLSWESFPYAGLIKTYNTDQQVPDSAGTATAFACGEKTGAGIICGNENVISRNCSTLAGNELKSIIHHAQDEGKWTGIVSTARITHATPASAFANSPSRDWECDKDVPTEAVGECWDIARQMIDRADNQQIRVLLGGGREAFIPEGTLDDETQDEGDRLDGRDMRQDWLNIKQGSGLASNEYSYVEHKADFDNIDIAATQYLLGLFEMGHMKYEADRLKETGDVWTEPSLAEMVKTSLDILKKGPDGYVLYVEGGRIDHAHHNNNAKRALTDVVALQDAVQVAIDETDDEDTLVIVTADHSHVFTMSGYQDLENDILDVVIADGDAVPTIDMKAYLTLSYANGPGFLDHRSADGTSFWNEIPRSDPADHNTTDLEYHQDAPIPKFSETHAGEDVGIYARGPMSHLFSGQQEQHYIAHAAMYIACIGWNKDMCENPPPPPKN